MAASSSLLQRRSSCLAASTSSRTVVRPAVVSARARAPARSRVSVAPSSSQWKHEQQPRWVLVAAAAEEPAAPETDAVLEQDFDLLSTKIAELTPVVKEELRGCSLFLVGMMGSGKSTLGKMLANTLKYAFFDTDTVVELAHDKRPVADIFKTEGQDYFRNYEGQVIKELSAYKNLVVATGGGAVLSPQNWGNMRNGIVVWLNGPVDVLARRVAKDGVEKRPLLADAADEGGPTPSPEVLQQRANAKLAAILEERTKFYENADIKVTLEGYGVDAEQGAPSAVVMYRLLKAVQAKIEATKLEREQQRQFSVQGLDDKGTINSMRVVESPNPDLKA